MEEFSIIRTTTDMHELVGSVLLTLLIIVCCMYYHGSLLRVEFIRTARAFKLKLRHYNYVCTIRGFRVYCKGNQYTTDGNPDPEEIINIIAYLFEEGFLTEYEAFHFSV